MRLPLAHDNDGPPRRIRGHCCTTVLLIFIIACLGTLAVPERDECRSVRGEAPSSSQPSSEDVVSSEDRDIWRIQKRCGVNSVYLFARLLGHSVRYDDVLDAIYIGKEGTSMADMKAYLRTMGLNAEIIKTTPGYLKTCRLPVVAMLERGGKTENHFSVVLAVSPSTVRLIDGTTGAVTVQTVGQFNEQWRGFLLVDRGGWNWGRWFSVASILVGTVTIAHAFFCFWRQKNHVRSE